MTQATGRTGSEIHLFYRWVITTQATKRTDSYVILLYIYGLLWDGQINLPASFLMTEGHFL